MSPASDLRVLLVDPSLFTAPYDAALTRGLLEHGVEAAWAARPVRPGDRAELEESRVQVSFYRRVERASWLRGQLRPLAKGISHIVGLGRVLRFCRKSRPHLVHFQWTVVPPLDSVAIAVLRWFVPVVLTVHDSTPFNGERLSLLQNFAFDWPIRLSDRVIVHTRKAAQTLVARGVPAQKISIIPHGPLPLGAVAQESSQLSRDARYTFTIFGEIKPYKGIDIALEALGLLPAELRQQVRLVVAGRPRMDLTPLTERIAALGLTDCVQVVPQRLSEQQMADLFAATDCFLMPYRQIDASGVYFLVKGLQKWLIASRVGIFAEDLRENSQGWLLPPGDATALASALSRAITERPQPEPPPLAAGWSGIAQATRELYAECLRARGGQQQQPEQQST